MIHFGADISVDIAFLGRHPFAALITAQIHIDTPWFLPDVTFKFEEPIGSPQPFDNQILNPPVGSAGASSPPTSGSGGPSALLTPPLSDGNADAATLYTFNSLGAVSGAPVQDVHARDDVPIVAVDADISIEYSNPVANDAAIASDTYTGSGDLGVQQAGDLTARYALQSISIQRSPRLGPTRNLDRSRRRGRYRARPFRRQRPGAAGRGFRWDADCRGDGVLSPRRLLVNGRTPYSITIASSQNDQEAVANDPGFPCCGRGKPPEVRWHTIAYVTMAAGLRAPGSERFSNDGDWWHWTQPPATINGFGSLANLVCALSPAGSAGIVGFVDFSEPVRNAYLIVDGSRIDGDYTVEAYRGLVLVDSQTIGPATTGQVSLSAPVDAGMTRLVLRAQSPAVAAPAPAPDGVVGQAVAPSAVAIPLPRGLELSAIAYLTCAEATYVIGRVARCTGWAVATPRSAAPASSRSCPTPIT